MNEQEQMTMTREEKLRAAVDRLHALVSRLKPDQTVSVYAEIVGQLFAQRDAAELERDKEEAAHRAHIRAIREALDPSMPLDESLLVMKAYIASKHADALGRLRAIGREEWAETLWEARAKFWRSAKCSPPAWKDTIEIDQAESYAIADAIIARLKEGP